MIRTVLAILVLVLYLILSLPLMFIFWLLEEFTPKAKWWYECIVHFFLKIICFICGVKATVIGRERIPTDTAVLFVGNHQSFFDVLSVYPLMNRQTAFIAKDSLKKVPVLAWNMLYLNCLFIDRDNMRQGVQMIKKATDLAQTGTSIFIYPEGTRNKSGDETNLAPFHGGSFVVAQRGKVPIIPVSFNNTEAIFERQFPKVRASRIVIEFGEPVRWDDMDRDTQKHVGEHFRGIIRDMIIKNQELLK